MSQTIFIITGEVGSGKTTRLGELTTELRQMGIHMAGFLSLRNLQHGERTGYTLVNIRDGSEHLFASTGAHAGWPRYGRFFFNPKALAEGEKIIKKAIEQKSRLVLIDEVGPLELEGNGWAEMLDLLLKEKELSQIWVVRENILDVVLERWNIPRDKVIHIRQEEKEKTLKKIIVHVQDDESSQATQCRR